MALVVGLSVLLVAGVGGVVLIAHTGADQDASPSPAASSARDPLAEQLLLDLNRNGADRKAAEDNARTVISAAATAQAVALLSGDRAAFTRPADPSDRPRMAWLQDRFTSLRAMGIAQWEPTVTTLTKSSESRWNAIISVKYCFVVGCARPLTTLLRTMWVVIGPTDPQLVEIYGYTSRKASPPWEQDVLQAKVGQRVVVAATAARAGELDRTLAAAEAAARAADEFAGAVKPGRYQVYLASDSEWDQWLYNEEGPYVAGSASGNTESVVLQASALPSIDLDVVLRHELGHVATLAGQKPRVNRADAWWLIEGIAEYIGSGPISFSAYPRRSETRAFVRNSWNGDLRLPEPGKTTSQRTTSARYGTAYLGIRCLIDTYGRDKTLAFLHAVAVEGQPLTTAASNSLQTAWPAVTRTCAARIRGGV